MQGFRNLLVWQKAHQLTLSVYKATELFPKDELYGLTSQMRRSAASIPTNLAEGSGRGSDTEFARFAQISMGSASELEYQLLLAYDLKFLNQDSYQQLNSSLNEVQRMLNAFIKKLRTS